MQPSNASVSHQCQQFDPKATMRFFRPKRDICAGKFAVLHVVSHGTGYSPQNPWTRELLLLQRTSYHWQATFGEKLHAYETV